MDPSKVTFRSDICFLVPAELLRLMAEWPESLERSFEDPFFSSGNACLVVTGPGLAFVSFFSWVGGGLSSFIGSGGTVLNP